MDFVDWCDRVLSALIAAEDADTTTRMIGALDTQVGAQIFGASRTTSGAWHGSLERLALQQALYQLVATGLAIYPGSPPNPIQLHLTTRAGREFADNKVPLWQGICARRLNAREEALLRLVNRLSSNDGNEYATAVQVAAAVLIDELGPGSASDQVVILAKDLADLRLVACSGYMQRVPDLTATYQGLVWETRRGLTLETQYIDALVAEWETTSVEFKREVHTDTADQKAELVKDVIGLVNTKASAPHWLIIGFDNKTHAYHGPPDPKLTQDHLEQLLPQYIEPPVQLRYRVVDYRDGPVGDLEVLRDTRLLPHRVKRTFGEKKKVREGQIFVRHGSQTVEPSTAEIAALEDEARRASE